MDLALGRYDRALERLVPLAGSKQEEAHIGGGSWGPTPADLRAEILVLLGKTAEALEDLDAGRISPDAVDLRFILAAELLRSDRRATAVECLAALEENLPSGPGGVFAGKVILTLRGETPVETLQEFVDTALQPALQPLGLFLAGLSLWAGHEDDAAAMSWSEAKNSSPDTLPAWHWASHYLGRVTSK